MGLFDPPSSGEEAAGNAIGSAIGAATNIPGASFVGSFLGGKLGSMFGGGTPRVSVGAVIGNRQTADGNWRLYTINAGTKGASQQDADQWGSGITSYLNSLADTLGLDYYDSLGNAGTNIGSKDPGTFLLTGNAKVETKISNTPGDVDAIVYNFLKTSDLRGKNQETLNYLKSSLAKNSDWNGVRTDLESFMAGNTSGGNMPNENGDKPYGVNANGLTTIQDENDPYARLNSENSKNNLTLLGAISLGIMLITKG